MIQIYKKKNTNFSKNGDSPIFPSSAVVNAELNGAWTLELEHPIDDRGIWKFIEEEAVIKVPSFNGDQLFRVRKVEKSDSGIEAKAEPIFLDAKNDCFLTDVRPTGKNGQQALDIMFRVRKVEKSDSGIEAKAEPIFLDAKNDCFLTDVRPTGKNGQQALDIMCAANKKYTAESNITRATTAYYQYRNLISAINGDDSNSFVNRWGGEILYDNYKVIINERVGGDYGVELLYGKNIKADGLTEEIDMSESVSVVTMA